MASKRQNFHFLILLVAIHCLFQCSCTKEDIKLPTLTTKAISNITQNTASSGGDITNDGGSIILSRGVCWSLHDNPTLSDSFTINGNGIGIFTSFISNLKSASTYYISAYATNKLGTSYGNTLSFNTNLPDTTIILPSVITYSVTPTSITTAAAEGGCASTGGGMIISKGFCWSKAQNPTINDKFTSEGSGPGKISSMISGLTQQTKYYVRAYASNNSGTSYGNQIGLLTPTAPINKIPIVETRSLSSFTATTAIGGGNVISDNGYSILARGVCWGFNPDPDLNDHFTVDGNGLGNFTSNLFDLVFGKLFYVRAYATNFYGTSYGQSYSMNTVADIDGNVYPTVMMNGKLWMAENLKVCRYRNGDPIPNVTDDSTWLNLVSGAYCNYNNDSLLGKSSYGKLYNWYAVTDSRNIAPVGWHVPTGTELASTLGSSAGWLKEKGTTHWAPPNTDASNLVGFNGLPAGWRYSRFSDLSLLTVWWASTSEHGYPQVSYNSGDIHWGAGGNWAVNGMSVRCVKD